MNGKEMVIAALDGKPCDRVPVCPYLAGEYLYARAGDLKIAGADPEIVRAAAHVAVYSRHDVDWVQIFGVRGAPRGLPKVVAAGSVGRDAACAETLVPVRSSEDLLAGGELDALAYVADKLGSSRFVAYGMPGPFGSMFPLLGFETMLVMLRENPEAVRHLLDRIVERGKNICKAARCVGADGIWLEEIFASADTISPADYQEFAFPCEKSLIEAAAAEGLKVMLYFCGDVVPRLGRLRSLQIAALAVEESKKKFVVDIGAVRESVGPGVCLFGNADVMLLLKDDPADLEREIARQISAAGPARFIVGVGSPVPPQTAPEAIDGFVETARRLGNMERVSRC